MEEGGRMRMKDRRPFVGLGHAQFLKQDFEESRALPKPTLIFTRVGSPTDPREVDGSLDPRFSIARARVSRRRENME